MKIGTVFDQTSANEFLVMLDSSISEEKLLFSYVELRSETGKENIIARITNVYKENPLLSRDQAGVSASIDLSKLGIDFSKRFTYGWAKCNVIGALTSKGLDMNRRGVSPNESVYIPSEDTLRKLFFSDSVAFIPVGEIETLSQSQANRVPITLNADQMVTKHFCIFGMTGSGKTNTSAKVLEELMARGHHMIVFDSHDDYSRLDYRSGIFSTEEGTPIDYNGEEFDSVLDHLVGELYPNRQNQDHLRYLTTYNLIQTASAVFSNTPARQIVQSRLPDINHALVNSLLESDTALRLLTGNKTRIYRGFPEIRSYGDQYTDLTINILAGMGGENFSSPQWRQLRPLVGQTSGSGIAYLQNLYRGISAAAMHDDTKSVLQARINNLQGTYQALLQNGLSPINLDDFIRGVVSRETGTQQNVHILSLTDLPNDIRKTLVYAIVTYAFRQFKFGDYNVRSRDGRIANANSVLFVLEEARSLIPKSSGLNDDDVSGMLARRSLREIAYEGRKFGLGFGLISQKPSSVDQEVVSQANTFIIHQLKSPEDQQYVRTVTDSMSSEELDMIKSLGTGRAIVAGVAVNSPVLMKVYRRYSEEGISEPTPIKNSLQDLVDIRANHQL